MTKPAMSGLFLAPVVTTGRAGCSRSVQLCPPAVSDPLRSYNPPQQATCQQALKLDVKDSTGNRPATAWMHLGIIRSMPRPPNINIKGQLVRQRRNDLCLTQQELAQRVYQLQDKSHIPERDALERRCRDWEVDNHISRQTLPSLATALGASVTYLLQGDAPDPSPPRIAQVADRLRNQVDIGATPAIQFIAQVRELSEMGAIPPLIDDAAAYWEAARALECRLGAAQLTADRVELATLAKLPDWKTADLLEPAAAHPYWLVHIKGTFDSPLRLVRGTESAIQALQDGIEAWCQGFSGEGRAVLVEDGPWLRIHLEEGHEAAFDQVVSIVRCEPGEAGLKYTALTDLQRDQIGSAIFPSLQPYFEQVGQLKFTSSWALAEQPCWAPEIRNFIGPIQPLRARGTD